jgi:hypothetical protein
MINNGASVDATIPVVEFQKSVDAAKSMLDNPTLSAEDTIAREVEVPLTERIDRAKIVTQNELVRWPGNVDVELPNGYGEAHTNAQATLIDALMSGQLSENVDSFVHVFEETHPQLVAVYGGYIPQSRDPNKTVSRQASAMPMMRTTATTPPEIVAAVKEGAVLYGDPYKTRPHPSTHEVTDVNSRQVIEREHVPTEFWPTDLRTRDAKQSALLLTEPEGVDAYLSRVVECTAQIRAHIAGESPLKKSQVLDLIAEQFQLLTSTRLFPVVNNSLHMNLLNAELKLLGYDPISHGHMDAIAHRFNTKSFQEYFRDKLAGGSFALRLDASLLREQKISDARKEIAQS